MNAFARLHSPRVTVPLVCLLAASLAMAQESAPAPAPGASSAVVTGQQAPPAGEFLSSSPSGPPRPGVVTGVELVGFKPVGAGPYGVAYLDFTLKNISGREVSAIVVNSRDDVTHSVDFFGGGHLAPGDTYVFQIATVESNPLLRVVALAYADGSFEGLSRPIDFLRSNRLGRALETKRLGDMYADLQPEEFEELGIEGLMKRVGRLPGTAEEAIASLGNVRLPRASTGDIRQAGSDRQFAFLAGVCNAREDALRELSQLSEDLISPVPRAEALLDVEIRSRFLSAQKLRYAATRKKQQQEMEIMK